MLRFEDTAILMGEFNRFEQIESDDFKFAFLASKKKDDDEEGNYLVMIASKENKHSLYSILNHGTSEKADRYYTGSSDDVDWRLKRHNLGWGRFTKRGIPWRIVYTEEYKSKIEALRREKEIKSKKSRKYIEELIKR